MCECGKYEGGCGCCGDDHKHDTAAPQGLPVAQGQGRTIEPGLAPLPGHVWQHKNGKRYFVTGVKNKGNPEDDDNNPPHVEYMDGNGGEYSRDIKAWHKSFTFQGRL